MKKVIVVLLCLFINAGWCSPYPVITSITPQAYPYDNYYALWITQAIIDVGPAADYVPPPDKHLGLAVRMDAVTPESGYILADGDMLTDGKSTLSQLALKLYWQGDPVNPRPMGLVNYMKHPGALSEYDCVGYIYHTGSHNRDSWSNSMMPGGCLRIPPVDQWCKITTPEIVLDHGAITLRNAESHSATASMNVQCVSNMAVSFKLVTDDKYVYLDDGKSEITVDNKPLNSKVDLPQGNSAITIKDMLTGVKTEGVHSGSSVLVMMPY